MGSKASVMKYTKLLFLIFDTKNTSFHEWQLTLLSKPPNAPLSDVQIYDTYVCNIYIYIYLL